jgi:hypothetical protein
VIETGLTFSRLDRFRDGLHVVTPLLASFFVLATRPCFPVPYEANLSPMV